MEKLVLILMESSPPAPEHNDVSSILPEIRLTKVSGRQLSASSSEISSLGNSIIKNLPEIIVGPISQKPAARKWTTRADDVDEEKESPAEESQPKTRKRTPRKINLVSAFRREVRATGALLLDFYQRFHKMDVDRTPRQHFCKEQVIKWVLNIMSCIQNQTFTDARGKEMFINLYNLFVAQADVDPTVTSFFYSLLVLLNASFGELQSLYQSVNREYIDYTALVDYLGTMVQETVYKWPPQLREFRTIRLLGAGSFGACYKVRHETMMRFSWPSRNNLSNLALHELAGNEYTVKIVSASSYPMIEHAIADRICASVTKHPMVVSYVACYPVNEYHVSIMEYFPGVDLDVVMKTMAKFDVDVLQYTAAQLVAGLQHMHYRGLLHRDMKLGNVLITDKGKVKIIDFDTAKICLALSAKNFNKSFLERTAGEHKDQEVAGTVPYMAPEVVSRRRYGRAADWWSLGVVLYRLLDGKLPFGGKADDDTRLAIQRQSLKFRKAKKGGKKNADARSFISALLEKNSVERLGTKSYDDLINHDFLRRMNWKHLRRVRIFDLPAVEDSLSQTPEGSTKPKCHKNLRPEMLQNLSMSLSKTILVYTPQCNREESEDPPILELTVDESSPRPSSTESLTRMEAESIPVLYHTDWDLNLTFGIATAEDGNRFPIIASLRPKYSKVSMLVEGDIVTTIDGVSVKSVPLSEAQSAVSSPGHHILRVLNSNPFRVFSRVLNSRPLLRNYVPFETVLTAPIRERGNLARWLRRSNQHFITVRQLVGKSLKGKAHQYFVISGVEDSVEANIFVGDVILTANGIESKDLSLDSLQTILKCQQGPVNLKILATSALRTDRFRFDRLFSTFLDNT